jgi:hypothetical protein
VRQCNWPVSGDFVQIHEKAACWFDTASAEFYPDFIGAVCAGFQHSSEIAAPACSCLADVPN